MIVKINNKRYLLEKSTRKNKKYDVYEILLSGRKDYITSFGDTRYEHYHDRIGKFSHLDHGDPKRRMNYRSRHSKDNIDDPKYAGFWAYNYLW